MKKLWKLYTVFFSIGICSFGGGYAMLSLLQQVIVEKYHWATEEELMDYYAIGQCTPGIIAVNTATYVGYKQAGFWGGLFATLGVISPSIIIICLVATVLKNVLHYPAVIHALSGIRIAVCALMLNTVVTMAKKGIVDKLGGFLFAGGFILACFSPIPTAVIIVLSGIIGVIAKRTGESKNS